MSDEATSKRIAVLVLGSRSKHSLDVFASHYNELGTHFETMTEEFEKGAGENGFLGQSYRIPRDGPGIELVEISYWRIMEDIHKFAHGPTNRAT